MSNRAGGKSDEPAFDLEERTAKFGEGVIHFANSHHRCV
jgi:hypothetical protein